MKPVKTEPAGRRTSVSPQRRAARVALAAGSVLAVAAAFGPVWIVRAGIVVALIAGWLAVRWAWQELRQVREQAGRRQVADLRGHNAQLSTERRRNLEVVEALQHHGEANAEKLVALQVTIGQLRTEISSLNGDKAALLDDVIERDRRIADLTAALAGREAELAEFWADAEADIVAIPRHAAPAADWDALPSAEDLWANGNHPTVVDLQKLAYPPVQGLRRQA
jgi:hypothetical protein